MQILTYISNLCKKKLIPRNKTNQTILEFCNGFFTLSFPQIKYFMSTHTHFKAVILQWWDVISDGIIDTKRVQKTSVLKQTELITSLFPVLLAGLKQLFPSANQIFNLFCKYFVINIAVLFWSHQHFWKGITIANFSL